MELPHTYYIPPESRLTGFPLPLRAIGWMPHHWHPHDHTVLTDAFVCLSTNQESVSETLIDGCPLCIDPGQPPSFSLLLPGTQMHSLRASIHDELFFQYPPTCVPALTQFFGPDFMRIRRIPLPGFPETILTEIRRELANLPATGSGDRLDLLAIQLFTEILLQYRRNNQSSPGMALKLHSIANALRQGKSLSALLRQFALSERTFYREWQKHYPLPPRQFILHQQLQQAAQELAETQKNIAAIAESCGFSSLVVFYEKFKQQFHCPPRQYREEATHRLLQNPPSELSNP